MKLGCAALLVCVLGSTALGAARSVTLLGVSGVGGERFARDVERDLADLYDVVDGDVYRATADKLDKRGPSPDEVKAVCTYLRLDAVIGGAVVGEGKRRRLLLAVRDGRSGELIARGRYDLSGRTLPLVRERVVADLVRALERVHPAGAGAVAQAPPAEESSGEAAPAAPAEQAEETAALGVEKRATPSEQAPQGVFASIGPSLASRSLSFDLASAPGYSSGAVAGLRATGVVYPFALSPELALAHPVLTAFGVAGSYEHVFDFTAHAGAKTSTGQASRWSVLFVSRIPLGHASRGGTLTLETGFQELSWSHASGQDIGVPDVAYDLVDAGLGWQRALGTRYLVLAVRAAYLAPVQEGALTSAAEYGTASGWGLEAEAGLTVKPARWLWLRASARISHVALSYAGAGTRLAHASTDDWAGGALEFGFAL